MATRSDPSNFLDLFSFLHLCFTRKLSVGLRYTLALDINSLTSSEFSSEPFEHTFTHILAFTV